MENKINGLLESLLDSTLRLEQVVSVEDSEPHEWLTILDEREELISQFQEYELDSESLLSTQKQQFEKIYEINQRLIPIIEGRKKGVQNQLNKVQRSKQVMNSYYDSGPNSYGAFIDRKK